MTEYVVDASVVIQRLIRDTHTPQARVLFSGLEDSSDELHVPEFCLLECANVLWKEVRFRGLSPNQAASLVRDLVVLPLKVSPASDLLPRALTIGIDHELPLYDSVYIVLAERLACPLITVDARQEQVTASVGVMLKPIADFSPAE